MASITIMKSNKNLVFAAVVANETGATFEEEEEWIKIEDSPELTLPRYCFDEAFDPSRRSARQGDLQLEGIWRSLLLNKRGYLKLFNDHEIVISDDKPQERRPSFLLRFPDADAKARAEAWAARAEFTLTDFILEAIKNYCNFWEQKARPE